MTSTHASRWMLSLADLALLLLGFFIMLYASDSSFSAVTEGARAAFLGRPAAAPLLDAPAASLFEPGEARLKEAARERLLALGRKAPAVTVESAGRDRAGNRFDSWELAAARAAAVARAVREGGVPEEKVRIVMASERPGQPVQGQMLVLR
jgi:flagellar motor protein MotB